MIETLTLILETVLNVAYSVVKKLFFAALLIYLVVITTFTMLSFILATLLR